MTWVRVHGLASQHKRLGVVLRAVLDRPVWGSAMRMCTAMLQGAVQRTPRY